MKAVTLVAAVVAAHGQYLDLPGYKHYVDDSANGVDKHGSVTVQRWDRIGTGFVQETMNPPALRKLTIPAGEQFPAKGNGGEGSYWLQTPATYVVTKGQATFLYADGTEVTLETGDGFYSPAGMKHGPITPAGDGEAVVMALGEWPPRYTEAPATIPTTSVLEQHAIQPRDADFVDAPPPLLLPACIKIYPGQAGVVSARMKPNCDLPTHYHPTGAFYFFTKGQLTVGGDIPGKNVTFPVGTSRWARPGWDYGPEASGNEETWFLVLGQPPEVTDESVEGAHPPPDNEAFVSRNNLATSAQSPALQASYTNDQAQEEKNGQLIPQADPAEQAEWKITLKQKRARRHLRSSVDLDESSMLQTSLLEDDDFEDDEL